MDQSRPDGGPPAAGARPGEIKIEVQPLFATPIALARLPDHDRLNAALKAVILARESTHPSTDHSNQGGWQSSWDMLDWGGEPAQALIGAVRLMAQRVTRARGTGGSAGPGPDIPWKVNCWANVNRSGHGNEPHTHPGALWSASYYVDDGGIAADPSLGGEFVIHDPRGVAPAMYQPHLTYAGPGGASAGATELLRPMPGLLVLFPSWLQHGVRPYRGTAMRISIAINLSV